jgi:hypothetical protein
MAATPKLKISAAVAKRFIQIVNVKFMLSPDRAFHFMYREPRAETAKPRENSFDEWEPPSLGGWKGANVVRFTRLSGSVPFAGRGCMVTSSTHEITELLQAWNLGDDQALEKLTPLVYEELYRAARRCISRGRRGNTLQTSDLINELYLRVIDMQRVSWQNALTSSRSARARCGGFSSTFSAPRNI